MTRNQALKVAQSANSSHTVDDLYGLLDVLQSLGLIKFDATDRDEAVRLVKSMGQAWANSAQHGPDYLTHAVLEDIEKMGLKIVRA